MAVHKVDWNAIEWKQIRKGVEQKAFSGSGATVAYIISGRMRFHIGQETHDIGPGGLLVIPSNVTHWGEVLGDEPVLNLDVFTPKRPEYAP